MRGTIFNALAVGAVLIGVGLWAQRPEALGQSGGGGGYGSEAGLREAVNDHGVRTRPVTGAEKLDEAGRAELRRKVSETLAAAERAVGERDLARADALLRVVLRAEPEHGRAAAMLRAMYEGFGAKLPVDEAALEAARGALGREYALYESRHFAVLSNCDREWTQQRMNLLEATYKEFMRTMERIGLEPIPPRHKLVCILIEEHGEYEWFARTYDRVKAPWVAGYYATLPNHVVMYDDATGPSFAGVERQLERLAVQLEETERLLAEAQRRRDGETAALLDERASAIELHAAAERRRVERLVREASDRKAVHEATHLVAFNTNIQLRSRQYPFWITEGIATNFETTDYRSRFGPTEQSEHRRASFERYREAGSLLPLSELVVLNEISEVSAERADVIYAQTYAFFKYAYRYHREELAGYLRALRDEPAGEIGAARHLEMFTERFGEPGLVERVWLRRERGS